jgi:hypothetical protein
VLAAVGTPARLIYCYNNRAYFTAPGTLALTVTDYHELYGADVITGADSFGDTLVLFTTSGTWMIDQHVPGRRRRLRQRPSSRSSGSTT